METLLLCAAAFIGGALNTIAGGGSFLTLPALMFIGASNVLPEDEALNALLDRFLIRVRCDYVDTDLLEEVLLAGWRLENKTAAAQPEITPAEIIALQQLCRQVDLSPIRKQYIDLVHNLRNTGIKVSDRRAVKIQNLLAVLTGVSTINQYLQPGQPGGPGINVGPGNCGTTGPAPTYNPLPNGFTANLDEDNVSWRGGLNWKPTPDILVYGNVSRGYKAGVFPTVATSAYTQLTPAKQEQLVAYAEALGRSTGQVISDPSKLIAPMVERFMATDRAFAKVRRVAVQAERSG